MPSLGWMFAWAVAYFITKAVPRAYQLKYSQRPTLSVFITLNSQGTESKSDTTMGLFDKIKDNFTKAEFNVSPQKKLKTLSTEFEKAFGVELVFYKGKQIADGGLTLKQLNDKTTKTVDTRAVEGLKIKGSMKVGDAEKLFDDAFGVTVQIKKGGKLVPNDMTIGEASRTEF